MLWGARPIGEMLPLPAATVCAHHWPWVPNLGDIRTIDWTDAPPVDILTAGFPCLNDTLGGPFRAAPTR